MFFVDIKYLTITVKLLNSLISLYINIINECSEECKIHFKTKIK